MCDLEPTNSYSHCSFAHRVLRETVESNEAEIAQLRRRCDSLAKEVQILTKEHAAYNYEKNKELSELHAELKMKAFQLTALGATFEVCSIGCKIYRSCDHDLVGVSGAYGPAS